MFFFTRTTVFGMLQIFLPCVVFNSRLGHSCKRSALVQETDEQLREGVLHLMPGIQLLEP